MNFDTAQFKAFQVDLKAKLTAKKLSPRVQQLIDLHANRTTEGIERGLRNSRAYYAIDRAYDVSQHQISPTLMKELVDRNPSSSTEAQALAKSFGIEGMIREVPDVSPYIGKKKGASPKPGYLLQAPIFYTVYVPLLLSYVKIRWAKLFNDRDLHPLYKYEPLVLSTKDRAVGKVVTARQQQSSSQMNHRATERDCIQKDLLYGQVLSFPREPWYTETQKIKGKVKIIKEGVRFENPHPTRVGYDMTHPLYTINSDTGVSWMFYWNMVKYGDIIAEKKFWLPKEKDGSLKEWEIPVGWRSGSDFFGLYQQLYPCTVKFPTPLNNTLENNRNQQAFKYSMTTPDAGIDVTVFFHKLNPKEWDLYDYDHEVWHRFVYAGSRTLLYCEPVFYCPGVAYLYDYDAERARNSSLGFELLPFQDQFGNLLSQQLLTIKKNLTRIVAVNKDVVDDDLIARIQNGTENALRGIEFFEYSTREMKDMETNIQTAFTPLPLQQISSAETIGAMNSLIMILERLLGYSSQEVGASASHQQSAEEVSLIAGSSNTRMQFTGGFIDDAIYARKKLLYYALINYGSDDILVQVSDMTPGGLKALKEMGFDVTEDDQPGIMTVKGSKQNLVFESVFSERDGSSRSNDQQTAVLLGAFLDRLMSNPKIAEVIPMKVIFRFFNQIADFMGLPADMKLPETDQPKSQEQQQQESAQMQQLITQVVEQTVGPALEQTSKGVAALAQKIASDQQEAEQVLTQLAGGQQQQNQQIAQLAQRQASDEQATQQLMVTLDNLTQAAVQRVG
jgi:hypothetical protein